MKEELEKLQEEVFASLATSSTEKEISDIRVRFLGRKGSLTQLLKRLGALPETDRQGDRQEGESAKGRSGGED